MNLDIQTTVRVIFFLLLAAGAGILYSAFRAFREAGRLRFFLKKRKILSRAWQLVLYGALVIGGAFLVNRYAEPVTYQVFEPSPTITLTPTVTLTSTPTLAPTASNTPTITITPEFTATPIMPIVISELFTSEVTPNPEARISPITFARRLDGAIQPVDPSNRFDQPNATIFGAYSYANMSTGAQITELWFRDGELIEYETAEWEFASGGYAYVDLELPAEEWVPGFYEVQVFVGEDWKSSGVFEVFGTPPTATPTLTQTITSSPTATLEATETPQPTETPVPTEAVVLQDTSTPTATLAPSATPTITRTPTITLTPQPTRRSTISR